MGSARGLLVVATALLSTTLAVPTRADGAPADSVPAVTLDGPRVSRAALTLLSDDALARIRARAWRRPIRLGVGLNRFEIHQARLLPEGAGYDRQRVRFDSRVDNIFMGGEVHELPPSPVPWSQINTIEVRHGRAAFGALAGALLMTAALSAVATSSRVSYEANLYEGGAAMVGIVLVPAAAGLGALVGALLPRWERVYQRRTLTSPLNLGRPRPAGTVSGRSWPGRAL